MSQPDYAQAGAIVGGLCAVALAIVKSAKGCYVRIPCCCHEHSSCILDFNRGRPADIEAFGQETTQEETKMPGPAAAPARKDTPSAGRRFLFDNRHIRPQPHPPTQGCRNHPSPGTHRRSVSDSPKHRDKYKTMKAQLNLDTISSSESSPKDSTATSDDFSLRV